jgi:hypothetical protein
VDPNKQPTTAPSHPELDHGNSFWCILVTARRQTANLGLITPRRDSSSTPVGLSNSKSPARPSLTLYYIIQRDSLSYRCQSDQPPWSRNMAPVNLVWLEDTRAFLRQFLGKVMRIQCDDDRIFVGLFKCTDKVCTCILSLIHVLTWGSTVT